MVQPYNYQMAGIQSPFESVVQGLRLGATLESLQLEREKQRQAMALAQQQAEQQRQNQEFMTGFFGRVSAGETPNSADWLRIGTMLQPEQVKMAENIRQQMTGDQQSNFGATLAKVTVGLWRNPEIGKQELRNFVRANPNSPGAQRMLEIAEIDPRAAAVMTYGLGRGLGGRVAEAVKDLPDLLGMKAGTEEDIRKKTADARIAEAQANLAPQKFAAELGLTQAQIEQAKAAQRAQEAAAAKSGAEAARAKAEAEQMARGVIPVDKRPDAESKLRKEYNDQTAVYRDVKSSYARVLASEETAAGDISLVFGFMKMLDPGSVVREGEFATAQNAAGVPDQVLNLYNRLRTGERLNPDQRKMFKSQARSLFDQAAKDEDKVRSGISRIATGYGLNLQNIFYTLGEEAPTAPGRSATTTGATGARGVAAPATQQQTGAVATPVTGGAVGQAITRRVEIAPRDAPAQDIRLLPPAGAAPPARTPSPAGATPPPRKSTNIGGGFSVLED